jgi:hypothetical protein
MPSVVPSLNMGPVEGEVVKVSGVGVILAFIGYTVLYYGVNAIQGNSQGTFMSYVFPFGS